MAPAAPVVTEFDIPKAADTDDPRPYDITLGPDGNLWYVEQGTNKVGKVVPGEPPAITNYPTPGAINEPKNITVGPDNNLWFTGGNSVGEVPPGDPANGEAHGGLGLISPRGIAAGPDGNLWVVDMANNDIKRVETDGDLFGLPIALASDCSPMNIARGPDNNMWVTCFINDTIVRVSGDGSDVDPFPVDPGNNLIDIASGPDGNLWFSGQVNNVGRITTAGTAQNFVSKGLDPFGITAGPDGAMWFAQVAGNSIGRVDGAGNTTEVTGLTANSMPRYISPGPANTLWFTEETAAKIGRITGIVEPGGGGGPGGGGTPGDTTSPNVTGLAMTDRTVVVGRGATPRNGNASAKTGTTIRYTLSEAASVRLRFRRALAGRRSGGKCVKPRRSLRRKRRCTRYKTEGTLTRASDQGGNSVRFTGRIGKKALKRGRYRLVVTATDAAGNKSKSKRTSFRVVKRRS